MRISQEQYSKLPERLQKHFNHGNFHCTVKPISLMKYLCRLVTPPGGIILDPFAGSGSTLIAAKQEGFNYIGIEMEAEYIEIAECRLRAVDDKQQTIFEGVQ